MTTYIHSIAPETTPWNGPPQTPTRTPLSQAVPPVVIACARAGDHGAFEVIFNAYHTAIYQYVCRMMGDAKDAEDLTADTFLKAYLALPRTSEDLKVGAWLFRIATNLCLDELRHRKLLKWHPWESFISTFHPGQVAKHNTVSEYMRRENAEEVQMLLEQMPPKYRMVLILREYQDLSYDEIAAVLNTTRAAIKNLLFRSRECFREVYAKAERQPSWGVAA